MNKKYLPALVCGFGASVLTIIPGLESFACCLVVPVAAAISIGLFKKSHPEVLRIDTRTGVLLGLYTGLFAAIFASCLEIILTFITKSNDLVLAIPQMEAVINELNLGPEAEASIKIIKQMVAETQLTGFSLLYSVLITFSNLLTYSIFGMLGGTLGVLIIRKRKSPSD